MLSNTRRAFMLAATTSPLLAGHSPRNQVAISANSFNAAWSLWANALNAVKPGILSMDEIMKFEPLEAMLREVARKRRAWIRGVQPIALTAMTSAKDT